MKIVIALGGTGGHVYPAQDLAKDLSSRGHQIYFAGKKGKFFSLNHFTFIDIATGNIRKRGFCARLKEGFFLCKGVIQSLYILQKISPDVIIGFGSFHSFPILFASILVKKKYILFEPNIVCGLVNRIFSKRSYFIATQFPVLKKHKAKTMHQTPFLPWEKTFFIQERKKHLTFVVFGGSQGAKFFNETVPLTIKRLKRIISFFEIIHITGSNDLVDEVKDVYNELQIVSSVKSYETNMLSTLAVCDFAICRSGAGTIGDLITTKTPAILVPYPFATDRHQEKNAEYFAKTIQGGIKISQSKLNEKILFQKIEKIIQNDRADLNECKKNLMNFYQLHKNRPSLTKLIEEMK